MNINEPNDKLFKLVYLAIEYLSKVFKLVRLPCQTNMNELLLSRAMSSSLNARLICSPIPKGPDAVFPSILMCKYHNVKCYAGHDDFAREVLDERTQKAEMWYKTAATRAPFLKPSQPMTCATFAQDASQVHEHKHQPLIFGPASLIGGKLTSERERIAAQVFQTGYRLPTMSIEEAGLREMEIMNKSQERNTKLMEEANSSWHKDRNHRENDEEDDDEAQERARAWDDW
ncbi:hypothetical protein IEQ34_020527 [Dendrobium chrysotoxum]|uniref:Uncharacterized protein n=1 Tax=Dendrobium chrysotoxum TaxID=161865 RepID=A0AAV7FKJ8_DENCH|nr:hypothetical protein IEQ34_020527 [Dendrobium chrysotoxum]